MRMIYLFILIFSYLSVEGIVELLFVCFVLLKGS